MATKATLVVSKEEAFEKISKQIEQGNIIRNYSRIRSLTELENACSDYDTWNEYNKSLLSDIFDNSSMKDGYEIPTFGTLLDPRYLTVFVDQFKKNVDDCLRQLKSIRDRLELFEVSPGPSKQPLFLSQQQTLSRKIFVVHGHDDGTKARVARFLERLDLQPIILSEQANAGQTIIEKFESSSKDVGYAVVLLTPDDVGHAKDKPEAVRPRARQNVILELGFFLAKLGRSRVCALYTGNVEIPSDYSGVLFLPLERDWPFRLAKEIKLVIKDIDLNKAFE